MFLASFLAVLQSKAKYREAQQGAGEQIHRGAGRADLCQHQRHRRPQRQARQMCHPQRDGEADQADQGAG